MKLKNRLLLIDVLILLAIVGIPMVILGLIGILPVATFRGITFYVVLGLCVLSQLLWLISILRKNGNVEDSVVYLQYRWSFVIFPLPVINYALYWIPFPEVWGAVITLIVDLIAFIGYYIVYSMYAHVSNKMSKAIESHKSERIEATKVETYEDENEDFMGSSIRRK